MKISMHAPSTHDLTSFKRGRKIAHEDHARRDFLDFQERKNAGKAQPHIREKQLRRWAKRTSPSFSTLIS